MAREIIQLAASSTRQEAVDAVRAGR